MTKTQAILFLYFGVAAMLLPLLFLHRNRSADTRWRFSRHFALVNLLTALGWFVYLVYGPADLRQQLLHRWQAPFKVL